MFAKINTNQIKNLLKQHWFIIILVVFFTTIILWLLAVYFRYIINPDALSYFTIAEKYAHFNYQDAINGYWGPLLSWLLVPAVWLGIPLDFAARAINILCGIGIMVTAYSFLLSKKTGRVIAGIICSFIALILADWILLGPITPDLIITWLIILFALLLSKYLASPGLKTGISLGVVGGLMYLAKAFGFYLFIAVIAIAFAWRAWSQRKNGFKQNLKWLTPVLASFFIITLPFIVAISVKYHQPTISVAGEYNMRVNGPAVKGLHPILTNGPLAPPNSTAVSAWEDPSYQTQLMPEFHIFSSINNIKFYAKSILKNIDDTSKFILEGSVVIALGALAMVIGSLQRKYYQRDYIIFLLVSAVLCGGYALVFTEQRYIWAAALLGLYSLGLLLGQFKRIKALNNLQLITGAIIICISMACAFYSNCWQRFTDKAITGMTSNQREHQIGQALAANIPNGARVISDDFYCYYYSYYMHAQCYNIFTPPIDPAKDQEYIQQLKNLGVVYLLNLHTRDGDQRVANFISEHYTPVNIPGAPYMLYTLN